MAFLVVHISIGHVLAEILLSVSSCRLQYLLGIMISEGLVGRSVAVGAMLEALLNLASKVVCLELLLVP